MALVLPAVAATGLACVRAVLVLRLALVVLTVFLVALESVRTSVVPLQTLNMRAIWQRHLLLSPRHVLQCLPLPQQCRQALVSSYHLFPTLFQLCPLLSPGASSRAPSLSLLFKICMKSYAIGGGRFFVFLRANKVLPLWESLVISFVPLLILQQWIYLSVCCHGYASFTSSEAYSSSGVGFICAFFFLP